MSNLKTFKKMYNYLGKIPALRRCSLRMVDKMHIRKNVVRIDTNNICNIQCIMCSYNVHKNRGNHNIMKIEDFKSVIDKLHKDTRFLYLSCGFEPLTTPNFVEYLRYAKNKNIPFISFATNGLLLKEKIVHCLVDNQISEIVISFNGFNREDYNRIMYKSDYDKVISNIKALNEYKIERNSIYPKIRFNCILMKSNILNFDEIVSFLEENKISTLNLRKLGVYEGQNNYDEVLKETLENIPQEEFKEIQKNIKSYVDKHKKSDVEFIIPNDILHPSGEIVLPNVNNTKNSSGGVYPRYSHIG